MSIENWFSPDINIHGKDTEKVKHEWPVINYSYSYECYVVKKKPKCESCKENFLFTEYLVVAIFVC